MKIYHNPRCSKSRQALSILQESDVEVQVINYLKQPVSKTELTNLISLMGIAPIDLIRKNEAIWKSHFKGKALSDDALITAMVNHPKLIERPIVVHKDTALIGRPPERVKTLL